MKGRILKASLSVLLTVTLAAGMAIPMAAAPADDAEASLMADAITEPLEPEFTLDKDVYENGDDVIGTLKIKNNNTLPVSVTFTGNAPDGYSVAQNPGAIDILEVDEEKTVTVKFEDTDTARAFVAKQKVDVSEYFKKYCDKLGVTVKKYEIEKEQKKLAKVNKKGLVTLKKPKTQSTVSIHAKDKDGNEIGKPFIIDIEIPKPAQKKAVQLQPGLTVQALNYFTGIYKAKVTVWKTSKKDVASIDPSTGFITTNKAGTAKITAVFGEKKNAAKYTFKVKVAAPKSSSTENASGEIKSADGAASNATASLQADSISGSESVSKSKTVTADDVSKTFGITATYTITVKKGTGGVPAEFEDNKKTLAKKLMIKKSVSDTKEITDAKAGAAGEDVIFTASIVSQVIQDGAKVELYEDDGDGNVDDGDENLGEMKDDGNSPDEVANDGVFTLSKKIQKDNRGEVNYYAKWAGSDDVKNTDMTPVYFYKEIPASERTNLNVAFEGLADKTTAAQVETYLSGAAGITNVSKKDENTVTFETDSGIQAVWEKKPENATEGTETTNKDVIDVVSSVDETEILKAYSSNGQNVLVLRPFHGTQFTYDDFETAGKNLENYKRGGSSTSVFKTVDDGNADLDAFKDFGRYDTVLLDSHGTKYNGNPYLLTGATYDKNNTVLDADYEAGRIVLCRCSEGNLIAVGDKWFDKYYADGSLSDRNTTLFLGTCYSSYNGEIIPKTLINKGAYAVYGYDNPVSVGFCNKNLKSVTDGLVANMDPSAAFDKNKKENGVNDPNNGTEFMFEGNSSFDATKGRITGRVIRYGSYSDGLTNAYVFVSTGSGAETGYPVDSRGAFNISLSPGTYNVRIAAYGYLSDQREVTVTAGETSNLGDAIMLRPTADATTKIYGRVDDAVNANPVRNAVIKFRKGRGNQTGEYLKYASGEEVIILTDSNGDYEFDELPFGYYTMEVVAAGFVQSFRDIVAASADESQAQNFSLSRFIVGEGVLRAVLWWGENPNDLDSHMVGPTPGGNPGGFHTWYGDRSAAEGNTAVADLDRDDTTSYGPETTTVRTGADGKYYFFIHNYTQNTNSRTGVTPITQSGAYVQVYVGRELKTTVYAPSVGPNYVYWNVFTYDKRTNVLTTVNTITAHPETGEYTKYTEYGVSDDLADYYNTDYDDSYDRVSVFSNKDAISPVKDEAYLEKTKEEEKVFFSKW